MNKTNLGGGKLWIQTSINLTTPQKKTGLVSNLARNEFVGQIHITMISTTLRSHQDTIPNCIRSKDSSSWAMGSQELRLRFHYSLGHKTPEW